MTQSASRRSEQAASIGDGRHADIAIRAYRCRLIQKLHERHEGHNVGGVRAADGKTGVALRRAIRCALRVFLALVLEVFIADAHLHAIGLTRENQQRLVLRLPAEPCDGAIVAIRIDVTSDTVIRLHTGIADQIVPDGCVCNRFDQPCAKSRRRNPEDHVVVGLLPGEIRLLDGTAGRRIRPASNCEKIMHSAVRAAVRFYLWDHAQIVTSKSEKVKEGEGLGSKNKVLRGARAGPFAVMKAGTVFPGAIVKARVS